MFKYLMFCVLLFSAGFLYSQDLAELDAYLKQMSGSDRQAQRDGAWAVDQLARMGKLPKERDAEVVGVLRKMLGSRDSQVRAFAMGAVSKLGARAAAAVPELMAHLKNRRSQDVYRAAYALGSIGMPASEKIFAALESTKSSSLRGGAARVMGFLGEHAAPGIPSLVRLLDDSSDYVRAKAEISLSQLGELAVKELGKALSSESAQVRAAAIRALDRIGSDARAVAEAIVSRLDDSEAEVRSTAIRLLGRIDYGGAKLVPVLIRRLAEEDEDVRKSAVASLSRLDHREIVPLMIPVLDEGSEVAVDSAARILEKLGTPAREALDALIRAAMRHPSLSSLESAIAACGQEAARPVFAVLRAENLDEEGTGVLVRSVARIGVDVVPYLEESLDDDSAQVRAAAAGAMGKIGEGAQSALRPLQKALRDEDSLVRASAVLAIAQIGVDERSLNRISPLLQDEEARVRAAATFAVGQSSLDVEKLVPLLMRSLEDGDATVRRPAVSALARLGSAAGPALEGLTAVLEDPELEVRMEAARAIGAIGPPAKSAIPALVSSIDEADPALCEATLRAIGAIGGARAAIPHLVRVVEGDHKKLRLVALESLGRCGTLAEPAMPVVEKLLRDGSNEERREAAKIIGIISSDGARAAVALAAALKLQDIELRRAAIESLAAMGAAAEPAVPALFGMLDQRYDQALAFEALQKIKLRSPKLLRRAMRHRRRFVRVFACECVADLGSKAGDLRRDLRRLRDEDGDWRVRKSAGDALRKLQ